MKTAALIPAYNAAQTIKGVIDRIPLGEVDEVIVVDDGSQDNTHLVLKRISGPFVILRHLQNRGYGYAQITLYRKALERGAKYMVNVHADGGLLPEEIPEMLGPLLRGEADVVVGSRTRKIIKEAEAVWGSKIMGAALKGPMPTYKFIANFILTALQNLCYGTRYSSFHCGFRACTAEALRTVPFDSLGGWYQYDTEFLLAAHTRRLRITEVPVSAHYAKDPSSSVPGIRYGLRVVSHALRYALARLNSRPR